MPPGTSKKGIARKIALRTPLDFLQIFLQGDLLRIRPRYSQPPSCILPEISLGVLLRILSGDNPGALQGNPLGHLGNSPEDEFENCAWNFNGNVHTD